jgi:hypothetical protein
MLNRDKAALSGERTGRKDNNRENEETKKDIPLFEML